MPQRAKHGGSRGKRLSENQVNGIIHWMEGRRHYYAQGDCFQSLLHAALSSGSETLFAVCMARRMAMDQIAMMNRYCFWPFKEDVLQEYIG